MSKKKKEALPISDSSIFHKSKNVLARKNADGELTLMNLKNEAKFYAIAGIAAEVWASIDGKTSLARIKQKLARKHNPPVKQFERDVQKFVLKLTSHGLIEK